MKKFRKKGQLFIEYLIVLPLLIISLWLILQLIVYVYANSQVDYATESGATLVAQQLRGTEQKIDTLANKEQILDDLYVRIGQSLDNNGFVLYSKDDNDNELTIDDYVVNVENATQCEDFIKSTSDKRVMCVYSEPILVNGREHEQVIVKVKVPFKVVGNFIPGLDQRIFLYGTGTATKEISGRFQWY